MADLAAKLQTKGAPLEMLSRPLEVAEGLDGTGGGDAGLLAFVRDAATLDVHRAAIVAAASRDRLTWVAYPKSGQLSTDLNRDRLAASLRADGLRPVRQVAIDEVWSALRFRPA